MLTSKHPVPQVSAFNRFRPFWNHTSHLHDSAHKGAAIFTPLMFWARAFSARCPNMWLTWSSGTYNNIHMLLYVLLYEYIVCVYKNKKYMHTRLYVYIYMHIYSFPFSIHLSQKTDPSKQPCSFTPRPDLARPWSSPKFVALIHPGRQGWPKWKRQNQEKSERIRS